MIIHQHPECSTQSRKKLNFIVYFKKRCVCLILLLIAGLTILPGCRKSAMIDDAIHGKALAELRHAMMENEGWLKVHAAEYLLGLNHPEGVKKTFLDELELHATTPQYRMGVWRTLARASTDTAENKGWIENIWNVYLDKKSADRLHATETLAKLDQNLLSQQPEIALELINGDDNKIASFVRWGMAVNSDDQRRIDDLVAASNSEDVYARKIAGYGIRFNIPLSSKQWKTIYQAAIDEPDSSEAAVYLTAAAYVRTPESEGSAEVKEKLHYRLRSMLRSNSKANRYHACEALAEAGTVDDIRELAKILNKESMLVNDSQSQSEIELQNADVRIAAANAILRISNRM